MKKLRNMSNSVHKLVIPWDDRSQYYFRAHTQTGAHTHILALKLTQAHAHRRMYTGARLHTHTGAGTRAQAQEHTLRRTYTGARSHTRTHTQARTHTHTRANTHKRINGPSPKTQASPGLVRLAKHFRADEHAGIPSKSSIHKPKVRWNGNG